MCTSSGLSLRSQQWLAHLQRPACCRKMQETRRSKRPRNPAQHPDYFYQPEEGSEDVWASPLNPQGALPANLSVGIRTPTAQSAHCMPSTKVQPCHVSGSNGMAHTSLALELGLSPACKQRRSAASAVLDSNAGPHRSPKVDQNASPHSAFWSPRSSSPMGFSHTTHPAHSDLPGAPSGNTERSPEPSSPASRHASRRLDSSTTGEPSDMPTSLMWRLQKRSMTGKSGRHRRSRLRPASEETVRGRSEEIAAKVAESERSERSVSHRRKSKPMRSAF